MLRMLISINVKDNSCDLFKVYIYLVLTENWLLYNPMIEDKSVIFEMWGVFLRSCSCQISSTDLRPHASKVCSLTLPLYSLSFCNRRIWHLFCNLVMHTSVDLNFDQSFKCFTKQVRSKASYLIQGSLK